MKVIIVLNASDSMGFGLSTISKFHYGQITTACLIKLLLGQRDAVRLALSRRSPTSDGDVGGSICIPPRSLPSQLSSNGAMQDLPRNSVMMADKTTS